MASALSTLPNFAVTVYVSQILSPTLLTSYGHPQAGAHFHRTVSKLNFIWHIHLAGAFLLLNFQTVRPPCSYVK